MSRSQGGSRGWQARTGVGLLLALAAGAVAASDGQTLQVSATILSKNTCRFTNAGPTQLAFGSVDPSGGTVTVSASTTFRCTGSDPVATYAVSSNDGLHASAPGQPRMRHATDPARFLSYALSFPTSAAVPRNTVQTFTVTGSMTPADFADVPAGTYLDSVVLTIEP